MTNYDRYTKELDKPLPDVMHALVAAGRGFDNLALTTLPVPQPGPNQLLARVDAAGVCTSIIKLIDQGPDHTFINGWDMQQHPVILGDEGSVTLVKIGQNLRDQYQIGQRFGIQPAVDIDPINHRQRYRDNAKNMHKCAVGYTLGGNLAQYILIQEEVLQAGCLLPLPNPDQAYFEVSMAEPISCVYSAQQRNYHLLKKGPHAPRQPHIGILPGGLTVVIGAGSMGRLHAEMALAFNPATLIVSDLVPERLDKVNTTIGPKAQQKNVRLLTVTPDKLADAVAQSSNNRGVDDLILAVGIRPVQQNALELLAPGGVANLFGGLPKGQHLLDLDALAVHYREIKLVGSSGGEPSDLAATLDAIAKHDVTPGNYVAAVGSLDNAIDVLRLIKETKIDGKAILYPHIQPTPLQWTDTWNKQQEIDLLENRL